MDPRALGGDKHLWDYFQQWRDTQNGQSEDEYPDVTSVLVPLRWSRTLWWFLSSNQFAGHNRQNLVAHFCCQSSASCVCTRARAHVCVRTSSSGNE